jgi:hypothetical protein
MEESLKEGLIIPIRHHYFKIIEFGKVGLGVAIF